MNYREYPVHEHLQPFITVLWSMEGDSIGETPPLRIFPDTCVELVVHYRDPYKTTFADSSSAIQERSFVVAQMKQFMEIQAQGRTGFVAVRFSARGAYRFMNLPMKELANRETGLREIWKNLAGELEERISDAGTMEQRLAIVQEVLLRQLMKSEREDAAIHFCLDEIQQAKGQISMEELAFRTGLSNRQLLRRFSQTIGLSPKEFARITKFLFSLRELKRAPGQSLTEIAYACGYYDQAHFIHDFREFSGQTPGEYRSPKI